VDTTIKGVYPMNQNQKILSLFAATLLLSACSGGGSSTAVQGPATITGQVQQGNVKGATVFLDLNGNGVKDAGEPTANQTVGDGTFTLQLTSADVAKITSSSKIVSEGGVDSTTGLLAGQLVSDLPALTGDTATKNITPMTTLTAMSDDQTKGKLKDALGSFGLTDSSGKASENEPIETASSAVIALCKSVESAMSNVQNIVSGKDASVATTVTKAVSADIGKALADIKATEITDTQKIADTISTAVKDALVSNQTQLGITDAQITNAVNLINQGCVKVAELVKGKCTGGSLSTTDHSKKESEIMSGDAGSQIRSSVEDSSSKVETETHSGGSGK
jgi:hypothetical protein